MKNWFRSYQKPLALTLMVGVLALGFIALHHLSQEMRLRDVRAAFNDISSTRLAAAAFFTVASYLALTLYDLLALHIIKRPLPWRTAALASFTSYTLSHNFGLSLLTGGSARYRIYSAAGLEGPDIARVVAIAGLTFWMGVAVVGGVALLFHSGPLLPGTLALPEETGFVAGIAILVAATGIIAGSTFGPHMISVFGWRIPVPRPQQILAQIGIAAIDLAAASAALFVLVPQAVPAMFPAFLLAYALAIVVALISHVPGGIGVFEVVMIAALPGDRATLFAALIAYRVIYYLLPLALGVALLAFHEGRRWRAPASRRFSEARALASSVAPTLLSASVFVGGTVLLLSGALPAAPDRLHGLRDLMPLPFVEASHIAASLAGTALLLLAPALYRRLDGAFVATRALLLAGAFFSLAKGFDYEEALVLSAIAAMLQWTRPAFYRRTAFTGQPLSLEWLVCVAAAAGLSLWIGFFAYRHVDYQNALWWQFAWKGDASRFLRASLAVAVTLTAVMLWRLLRPAAAPVASSGVDGAVLARGLAVSDHTDAMLSLLGDKRFLVSQSGDAFLMHQVQGSSWIVMADPVGTREDWPELLWMIRGLADAAQGRLILYQISADTLPIAIELGLRIIKYGEEALVDLQAFTLQGPRMRALRHMVGRAEREGVTFSVVPASEVRALLPSLRAISDEWLADKRRKEKGFSLGWFDPEYLARFDCAIVRQGARIVAFANMWATPNNQELSVDLMRHVDDAPPGTMDFLFARLMLWGREQGYRRFSLGLAPLSGIEARRLSPAWAKAASFLFRHGERWYGFKGLRAYKDKFAPAWVPRYIAGPSGFSLLHALADLKALINRPPPSG